MSVKSLSRPMLNALKKQYPIGSRIELVKMDDPYSKLRPGDLGTVTCIDDTGTVFASWDIGSSLGAVYGEDIIKRYYDKGDM